MPLKPLQSKLMEYIVYCLIAFTIVKESYCEPYEEWSEWTKCSTTCGQGEQERLRDCVNGRCVQRQKKTCFTVCNGNPVSEFKQWQEWTACSQTCGQGSQERKRECTNGRCVQRETKTCRIRTCQEDGSDEWSEWSKCSATCGQGTVTRRRQCPVGNCEQVQRKTCFSKVCDGVTPPDRYQAWQKWSTCSTTCGPGERKRTRKCIIGNCQEIQTQTCVAKSCPTITQPPWGEWGPWTECSATCGDGTRKRTRKCLIGVCEQIQTSNCKVKECVGGSDREYKEWGNWGKCSVTCGIGAHRRIRACANGLCQQVMRKTCFRPTCPGQIENELYLPWTSWSGCSVTCNGGERQRTRQCRPPGSCIQRQAQTCGIKPCNKTDEEDFTEWSRWSSCSATCGNGEAKRYRVNVKTGRNQEQLKKCKDRNCETGEDVYKNWLGWSGCSVTCGIGLTTRVRFCRVGNCRDTETKPCTLSDCQPLDLDAKYGPWQKWSPCDATCGFGFSRRKRYCRIGGCEQTSSKTCRLGPCPTDYTEWEDWSECSVTCGSGTAIRKRFCTVGKCEEKQQTVCDMAKCGEGWEDWAEWHECHKSCGGGFEYRVRKCKEGISSEKCPGDNYDYRRCNTHACINGTWTAWNNWGDCSATCGNGLSSRNRTCQKGQCAGKSKETRRCNSVQCVKPRWSNWSVWSECSVTCGSGERARSRICIDGNQWDGCLGSTLSKEVCKMEPCDRTTWSKWTPWRPCPVTCGQGTTNRERVCIGGDPGDPGCRGSTSQTSECEAEPCLTGGMWNDWGSWSSCSLTCNGGISSRSRSCGIGASCEGESLESMSCNTDQCFTGSPESWGSWSPWTECSVSCGIGTIARKRTCSSLTSSCEGSDQEVKVCAQKEICSEAQWGEWQSWSKCSATCGDGLSVRIRQCLSGTVGDDGCKDGGRESKDCNEKSCTGSTPEWSLWSRWSPCPVTCGSGTQSRSRICSIPGQCKGFAEEAQECDHGKCASEPQTGTWGPWEKWQKCSVPCGVGTSSRTRECNGGNGCKGRKVQKKRCKRPTCEWSSWENYGECSVTCGIGTMSRVRKCANGAVEARKCEGQPAEFTECTQRSCAGDRSVRCPRLSSPANAIMVQSGPWKPGVEVAFSCNEGYQTRGQKVISCGVDGRWSGPIPFCTASKCDGISDIESTCRQFCNSDSDCAGNSTTCNCDMTCGMICLDIGQECEVPSTIGHGYVVYNKRSYGHTATYGCNSGYILQGYSTRICGANGRWMNAVPKCFPYGTPGLTGTEKNSKIAAKTKAAAGDWPWQVLVLSNQQNDILKSSEAMLGGGSLINNKWILTSAHIFRNSSEDFKSSIIFVLGAFHKIVDAESIPQHTQLYQPDLIIKHENFNENTYDNDIALVRVGYRLQIDGTAITRDKENRNGEVVFNDYVRPVALPCLSACNAEALDSVQNGIEVASYGKERCKRYARRIKSLSDPDAIVTGYGGEGTGVSVIDKANTMEDLRQAAVKLQKHDYCSRKLKGIRENHKFARFTSRMMCTDKNAFQQKCVGSAGDPLVKQVDAGDRGKCWVQVGILTWKWDCESTEAQYYTSITTMVSWISKTLTENVE